MRAANAEMLQLYRTIGATLLERMGRDWTAEVADRLGADLRRQFPDMAAMSPDNLDYMRRFAQAWPDPAGLPELEALPWGHIRVLLDRVDDRHDRDQLATAAVRHGWSQDDLLQEVLTRSSAERPAST